MEGVRRKRGGRAVLINLLLSCKNRGKILITPNTLRSGGRKTCFAFEISMFACADLVLFSVRMRFEKSQRLVYQVGPAVWPVVQDKKIKWSSRRPSVGFI